jgi:ATP-dependent DNA helicase RecG
MFLGELQKPVGILHGAGAKAVERLARLGIETIADLLLYAPRGWEDRSSFVPIAFAGTETPLLSVVEVVDQQWFGRPPRQTLKVIIRDETGSASLICFNRNFLSRKLLIGKRFIIHAPVQYRRGELQSTSFDFEPVEDSELSRRESLGTPVPSHLEGSSIGRVLPLYPLTEGITHSFLRELIRQGLEGFGKYVDNEIPPELLSLSTAEALRMVHRPETLFEAEMGRKALAFQELFHLQFAVNRRAALRKECRREPSRLSRRLLQRCIESLPFSLTRDQNHVVEDIISDLEADYPMARLLQGDVGCGKTLTAFLSAIPLIEAGYQVAFMAPTELLARQHAENGAILLEPLGIRIALFTGSVAAGARKELLSRLETGEIDLIIGTHTLFSRNVSFRNLRYCIIDEQHKFGVMQRLGLLQKGNMPDLLMMTATPIPRTMALTAFGDLAVSSIRTMPPGRKPVVTHLAKVENRAKVYAAVEKEIQRGGQAYFVYPLISEGKRDKINSAEEMFHKLSTEVFRHRRVSLIHSKIDEELKEKEMHRFLEGDIDILVATSVVEVGVDAPGATIMVIEHAEQFGLSALHQLRGRVGRSSRDSWCFLIFSENLTETGTERLRIMKEHNDGFIIAEEDLKLRGPGELSGMKQAGVLELRFADLSKDGDLLEKSREAASLVAGKDPHLLEAKHEQLRKLYSAAPPFEDLASISRRQ